MVQICVSAPTAISVTSVAGCQALGTVMAPAAPSASTTTTIATCQICFDELDLAAAKATVTAFCSPTCPAVLCVTCLQEHVRVAVMAAFPGVLPRVRCPICLTAVNKATWSSGASAEVLAKYATACEQACSLLPPCCHNRSYTQLPSAREGTLMESMDQMLDDWERNLLHSKWEALEQMVDRFTNHALSKATLISFVEQHLGGYRGVDRQTRIFLRLLEHIPDEERRATLLLAYHATYRKIHTRCHDVALCFNCKREWSLEADNSHVCDKERIEADCVVECRSCRVLMVKVEGCDDVKCWCGFRLNWAEEVVLRNLNKMGALSVDIYDLDATTPWIAHESKLSDIKSDIISVHLEKRLNWIDQNVFKYARCLRVLMQYCTRRARSRKMLRELSTRAYWLRYYEDKPERLDAMKTEMNELFMTGSHGEGN